MSDQLAVSVALTNEKVQMTGTSRTNPSITCDYFPPLGYGAGYTGLELLLMSLAVCSGTSVLALLRKMGKTVAGFNVNANGSRREVHPTSFEKILLEFVIHSKDAGDGNVQKAIKLSEESICPVWAMLKNNVEIVTEYKIVSS